MKVSTRLLISLLPTVGAVMVIYGAWAQQHREEVMTLDARRETEAYARALAVVFQYGLREARQENVQEILNLVSRAPAVYGILVYDSTGRRVFASAPPPALTSAAQGDLRRVLATGAPLGLERQMAQRRVYSVLEPIRKGRRGRPSGVLEVAQPLAHVEAEVVGTRWRFVLNTLTLFAALTLVVLWLVRQTVRVPMQGMVTAVRALGRGELAQRIVPDPTAGELGDLAREFNSMADSLQAARMAAQHEAEERLLLERRLRESEKMAAIGTLAAGLAHEIAAPLNVIAGRAAMLLRRSGAEEKRYLEIIVHQTGRITSIVKNLLAFARRREARTQPVELRQIAGAAAELLDGEFTRAGVAINLPKGPELWASADPDLLQHVLVNLLLNALQAVEPLGDGGRVTVSLRSETVQGRSWAVVEVSDTGPGIPENLRGQVFNPFFTTKPDGTGLGLALARSMVEEQGGRIMVADSGETSRGAVLRVELPALGGAEQAR